jgi:hypothetical protein
MALSGAERTRNHRERIRLRKPGLEPTPVPTTKKVPGRVPTRTLSKQEAWVVLTLEERGQYTVSRQEVVEILKASQKAADHVIAGLRDKGWFEREQWGRYKLIPFSEGSTTLSFDRRCKT